MLRWYSLVLALAFALAALAHRIEIDGGSRQCFFETLSIEDRMTVTYEVGGSTAGNLDIDMFVSGPDRNIIYRTDKPKAQDRFALTAASTGKYMYCFSNEGTSYGSKTVLFNVHGVLKMDEDESMAPVEREIRNLASALQMVKDEQSYLVVRERVHRNTSESTNSRVKWWAIIQVGLLLAVCAWNVHYLKSWFEVKRIL